MRASTSLRILLAVIVIAVLAATPGQSVVAFGAEPAPDPAPTESTVNEFLPEERGLGECISAVPKPGCGSEARGGWRQGLVLLAILLGLGVIAWRVIAASRAARRRLTEGDEPTATVG